MGKPEYQGKKTDAERILLIISERKRKEIYAEGINEKKKKG